MQISQSIAKAIKDMAKKANIPVGQMLTECGISKNAMSSMQSGGYLPRIENLVKIADYLDCSVDYLLERTSNPQAHKCANVVYGDLSNNSGIVGNVGSTINATAQSGQAAALLELFNNLDPIKQAELVVYANELSKKKD